MADKTVDFHTLRFDVSDERRVRFTVASLQTDGEPVLGGELGLCIPARTTGMRVQEESNYVKIAWDDYAHVEIFHGALDGGGHSYNVRWLVDKNGKSALSDQFDMKGAHWYGAAQVRCQTWPIENWNRKLKPYVNGDSFADEYGGVQERYWMSSAGVALFVEPEVPLFVSMNSGNDGKLVLTSKFARPYKNVDNRRLYLTYTLFQSSDVISVHRLATGKVIARPHGIPDEKLFRFPIWSTWARYKKQVDQATVLRYADEIRENGFSASQIEIDDDWTPAYGDMEFDPVKFPQPKAMVDRLAELGFRVTLWVHPFASPKSKAFYTKAAGGGDLWVTSPVGGLVTWWNGVGRYMDVTNPDAVRRFTDALRRLQDRYDIASFKFDAGEANWLPAWFRTRTPLANPSAYSRLYAETAYAIDPEVRCQEVRVGARTQHLPLLVRMMDKNSNWTYENGLKTLIPHALLFGVIGYPFMLPDMIGGNAYGSSAFPERELFVRWLQANALLPCMQFSIAPWSYDAEVVEISLRMVALHEHHADRIVALARDCTRTGAPIVRPLWWVAPRDPIALSIDSEFLVGDDLLVAPVLDRGATTRDVYLPPGLWLDEVKGDSVEGGKWLKCYDAPLDVLPHFTRQEPSKTLLGDNSGSGSQDPETSPDTTTPQHHDTTEVGLKMNESGQ